MSSNSCFCLKAREKEAGANNNAESPPITQPAISPTPPKTPRRASTPRRVSSRLSNPSTSRPVSRSSINSPSKVEKNQERTEVKNTDGENASNKVADNSVKNPTEKENDQGNGNETAGSHDESKHTNEETRNRTDDKGKSQVNTAEQDVSLDAGREDKKSEDNENHNKDEVGQVSHSSDEKPGVDINDNKVEEKDNAEKGEEIGKPASNETKE